MTTPKPVTAYAAVSPDGRIDCDVMGRSEETARAVAHEWYEAEIPLSFIPVTILPTEQYEAMAAIIAAAKVVVAETGSPVDANQLTRAICELEEALSALKDQGHG